MRTVTADPMGDTPMEYGFGIPTRFPLADHPSVEAIATHAEVPGFSRLAVSDHFIPLLATDFRYPYTGAFPDSVIGEYMEQFTFIVFLAALTLRGWLLTSITAAPSRDAIETTKLVSTTGNVPGSRLSSRPARTGWRGSRWSGHSHPPQTCR